ncbi:MAG: tRNA (adenosine(37)-N6)-threonylcarbamoyltransferase complex dimerization subunit type 1 TsaB [Muricomes sp.]
MRVLAIDSSGLTATVAVVEEDRTIAEYTIDYKKTHSQTLLPMIDEVVKMIELDLETIDAIAVSGGPGSFTGLRIGSATAKGLGLALGKPLIHIPTVDGLAYQVYGCEDIICPILDARRSQVYTGLYTFSKRAGTKEGTKRVEPVFQVLKMQMAVSIEELIHHLNVYRKPVVFLGDGVPVFSEIIEQNIQVPYSFAPPHMSRQRAAAVEASGNSVL